MARTFLQNDQIENAAALPSLGMAALSQNKDIFSAIEAGINQPMRMYATFPTADSKLNFKSNKIQYGDGTSASTPPVNSTIPTVVDSWIDFQSGGVSGSFDITLPTTTVGQYRRCGFTLLSTGQVKCLFSGAATSVSGLDNPGTLFVTGSIPIGWIDLEATASTAYKTIGSSSPNYIQNAVGGVSRIVMFGSGGSGGSGDASTNFETLRQWYDDAPFDYMMDNIFAQKSATEIASATMTQNLVNNTYKSGVSGQYVLSAQSLDSTFLTTENNVSSIELMALWLNGAVDTAATYQVSRDGGTTLANVTMAQVGAGNAYRGVLNFAGLEAGSTLITGSGAVSQSQTLSTFKFAQAFTVANTTVVQSLTFPITKTGTPSGYLYATIRRDNAGFPSTASSDIIASSVMTAVSSLSTSFTPSISAVLTAGVTYHVVLESVSVYDGVNNINTTYLGAATPRQTKWDGTSAFILGNSGTLNFSLSGFALDLRVKITSSMASELLGYGILYSAQVGIATGILLIERQSITTPTSTFTIGSYFPDSDLLNIYCVQTGQCWAIGSGGVTLNGKQVVFPAGSFGDASVSNPYTLVFRQTSGGAFDNSDRNGGLLSDNRLGSMDATLDKSVAGQGIILRCAVGAGAYNNKRCEIWLDSFGNLKVSSLE